VASDLGLAGAEGGTEEEMPFDPALATITTTESGEEIPVFPPWRPFSRLPEFALADPRRRVDRP
jgi:hypothetical protein